MKMNKSNLVARIHLGLEDLGSLQRRDDLPAAAPTVFSLSSTTLHSCSPASRSELSI